MQSEKEIYNLYQILEAWEALVSEDKGSLYKYSERVKHLEYLMDFFVEHNIDRDEAQSSKKKVIAVLVHPNGMKVKDPRHKGWKENAEKDFDQAIIRTYVQAPPPRITSLRGAQEYDPDIISWAKNKFGKDVDEEIIKACHQQMNVLQIMFMNEYGQRKTGGKL